MPTILGIKMIIEDEMLNSELHNGSLKVYK